MFLSVGNYICMLLEDQTKITISVLKCIFILKYFAKELTFVITRLNKKILVQFFFKNIYFGKAYCNF
jgi:hypothetical protein